MTTTTPLANPSLIGLAHYAGRALLENVLTRHGMTFQQSIALRSLALADGPVEREAVVAHVVGSLKIDTAEAHAVVDELDAAGLLTPEASSQVRITDAGRVLYATTSGETAPISARIYAGIPTEDLAAAGRVLSLITERANAELAAMTR